jgi:hypothetical protein
VRPCRKQLLRLAVEHVRLDDAHAWVSVEARAKQRHEFVVYFHSDDARAAIGDRRRQGAVPGSDLEHDVAVANLRRIDDAA